MRPTIIRVLFLWVAVLVGRLDDDQSSLFGTSSRTRTEKPFILSKGGMPIPFKDALYGVGGGSRTPMTITVVAF